MSALKSNYGKSFVTGNVTVKWSHLMTPDDKFGNPNHSVTVEVTPELDKLIKAAVKQLGGKKINGFKEQDGIKTIKFKNTLVAKSGEKVFPVTGPDAKPTTTVPFGTDVVRVKVTPGLITRDNSVSFYLEGIQLIERNYVGNDSDFKPVEDTESPF